jgi:predicted DNA-binding transcriptional regulator AlpA
VKKKDLAARLGITRPTLDSYLNMKGAPRPKRGLHDYDEEEVAAWVKENAGSEKTSAKVDPQIKDLKARELKLKCERLEVQIKKEKDKYFERDKLGPLLYNLSIHQRNVLQKNERDLANIITGITPQQLAVLKESTDRVCRIMREGIREFLTETAKCPKCGWRE